MKRFHLQREAASHKGDYGHALIVAGSGTMPGAAHLTVEACLRSGVGKVTLASSAQVIRLVSPALPEAMMLALKSSSDGTLHSDGFKRLADAARSVDAIAIGPGLGRTRGVANLTAGLIRSARKPMIIDADAIMILKGNAGILRQAHTRPILTPHPGELRALTSRNTSAERLLSEEVAKGISNQYHCVLVRKGSHTLVADPCGNLYANRTGNPGMASGGSGDVLTGVIAALVAQGFEPFFAARLGVYAHGRAGDLAARQIGQTALVARDLLERLPLVWRGLEKLRDLRPLVKPQGRALLE
ncbi:MAG: NAD(P)H-hydrate dehydratase [Candidatus Omnitrophica bacterium]|nr:NAD(P)H-hydrate dehydratase [Candidatus Omnitrophota bacterium]